MASASRAALIAVGVMYDDGAACLREEMPSHRGSDSNARTRNSLALLLSVGVTVCCSEPWKKARESSFCEPFLCRCYMCLID